MPGQTEAREGRTLANHASVLTVNPVNGISVFIPPDSANFLQTPSLEPPSSLRFSLEPLSFLRLSLELAAPSALWIPELCLTT